MEKYRPSETEHHNFVAETSNPERIADLEKPSFDNLRSFVGEAAQLAVQYDVEQRSNQTNQKWANQWNILGTYLYTTATHEEISEIYGCTRERVRQIVKSSALKLHAVAPPDLQAKYLPEAFDYRKPLDENILIKRSEMRSSITKDVIALTQEGKTAKEIRQVLGITGKKLAKERTKLKRIGLNIEHQVFMMSPEMIAKLQDHESIPLERQAILDQLNVYQLANKNHPVIKLSDLTRAAGINTNGPTGEPLDRVINAIESAGLPIRIIERQFKSNRMRYGVVAEADRDAVLEVLRNDDALEKFRKKV